VCSGESGRPSLRPTRGLPKSPVVFKLRSFTSQSIRNKMSSTLLTCRREVYLEGLDATELNTVDIWFPGSDLASEADEKLWVVFVFIQYSTSHSSVKLTDHQIYSRRSLARS
jgi:hypothetical protein